MTTNLANGVAELSGSNDHFHLEDITLTDAGLH